MDTLELLEKINHVIDKIESEKTRVNELLMAKEKIEIDRLRNDSSETSEYTYPSILDPNFNIKIANKREFYEMRYDEDIKDIESEADKLCNATFELAPHQMFVRNFMSRETPYNSLLLFHGLGTGKTCSAISIAEDTRKNMKYKHRILVIASPNVQENFRKQLFDSEKLKEDHGIWTMHASCTGNKLLQEINPIQQKGISKTNIIKQMKHFIDRHYEFISDKKLSNRMNRIHKKFAGIVNVKERNKLIHKEIRKYYSNRLIIIDEVHNIRDSQDSKKKKIAKHLLHIAQVTTNMKLILLSATPMFDNHKEIIYLVNLMNANDNRPTIVESDVFYNNGDFVIDERGNNIGQSMLERKSRGYISFVRGENVYSFPYRIFPTLFDKEHSVLSKDYEYPSQHILGDHKHVSPIEFLDLFMLPLGAYQELCYQFIVKNKTADMIPDEENVTRGLGWKIFRQPVQCLNMTYPDKDMIKYIQNTFGETFLTLRPHEQPDARKEVVQKIKDFEFDEDTEINIKNLTDIHSVMNSKYHKGFSYKKAIETNFGRIFSPSELWKYSHKIYEITQRIKNSKGIVLVYSQYIEGGCIPLALALEEMGIKRYKNKSLFKKSNVEQIDSLSMKPKSQHDSEENTPFQAATYVMITGNKNLSEDNAAEVRAASTMPSNAYGKDVKVVIISKAGSEGIDFKCIRQVHILDPWYNNNRNEQIIGRAVRFCSHASLPYKERNVEIYLYGSQLTRDEEAIDLFIYRMAESKSLKIGHVARVLKANAIDCLLTKGITNMSEDRFNKTVQLKLGSNTSISYKVGDKPFSETCDYLETCSYQCKPEQLVPHGKDDSTYNKIFIELNVDKIIHQIKLIFQEHHTHKKKDIVRKVRMVKEYPESQIEYALHLMTHDNTEFIRDKYDRLGRLVTVSSKDKDVFMFQPIETKHKIRRFDRVRPFDNKHKNIQMIKEVKENKSSEFVIVKSQSIEDILETLSLQYSKSKRIEPISRGNTDWYKHIGHAIERIHTRDNISKNILHKYVVHHMVDSLNHQDKKVLFTYLLQDVPNDNEYIPIMKTYMKTFLLKKKVYMIADGPDNKYYITEDDRLVESPPLTMEDVLKLPRMDKGIYNTSIFGFMSFFKDKNDGNVFKMKTFERKNMSGAVCKQATKQKIIQYIHSIIDTPYAPKEITKITSVPLCGELELMLRHFDYTKKDDKKWFLHTEDAIFHKVSNL